MKGQTVCRKHGGKAPQALAAAEQRVVAAEAEQLLARVWNPDAVPVKDPVAAMQRLAGQLEHAAHVLGSRLEVGPPCEECGRADLAMDSAGAAAWLRVLREDRQLLTDMERHGILQHQVQVEADRIRLVAAAVGAVFAELGLDDEQRRLGMRVLLGELRASADVVAGEVAAS